MPRSVSIAVPADDTQYAVGPASVSIDVRSDDVGLGVRGVGLEIDAQPQDFRLRESPYVFALELPDGEWHVVAVARDWGGNVASSEPVVLWVGERPAVDGTTGSALDSDGGTGDSDGVDDTTISPVDAVGTSNDGAAMLDPPLQRGCSCRSGGHRSAWWLVLGLLGLRRRRAAQG